MKSLFASTGKPSPWSPLSVAVIAFLLPAGGAVLTIANLQRLQELTATHVLRLKISVIAIFALGQAVIFILAPLSSNGLPTVDANADTVIRVGVATAAYVVQRPYFRRWSETRSARPSAWTSGILQALLYEVIADVGASIIYALLAILRVEGAIA